MPLSGNTKLWLGIGLGMVAAGAVRQLLPGFSGLGRPLAKAAVKSSLVLFDKTRLQLALMKENLEDLTAEARSELATDAQQRAAAGAGGGDAYAPESAYPA